MSDGWKYFDLNNLNMLFSIKNKEIRTKEEDSAHDLMSFESISMRMRRADYAKYVGLLEDKDKLEFYGFYKQATVGNINISRPGMMRFKERAKYNAW